MRPIDADMLKDMMIQALNDATHEVEFGRDKRLLRDVTLAFMRDIDECPTIPTPQWISVEERLPEESYKVLYLAARIFAFGEWMMAADTGRYMDGHFVLTGGSPIEGTVTHWMPLPDPPKEDNHGQTDLI